MVRACDAKTDVVTSQLLLVGARRHRTLSLPRPPPKTIIADNPTNWGYIVMVIRIIHTNTHTHTHTHPFNGPFPGLPRWAGTRKVEPIWILLKQETVSGSGISWARCKSAPCSRQITTPASHYSVFLQAGCPSCRPTNSVKALKGFVDWQYHTRFPVVRDTSFFHNTIT